MFASLDIGRLLKLAKSNNFARQNPCFIPGQCYSDISLLLFIKSNEIKLIRREIEVLQQNV